MLASTQISSHPSLHQLLYPSLPLALRHLSPGEHFSHGQVMNSTVENVIVTIEIPYIKTLDSHPPLSISAGLPPVPHKMVIKIQHDEFKDMVELLLDVHI